MMFLVVLGMISAVSAGVQSRCMAITGVSTAGLVVTCVALFPAGAAPGCAAGVVAIGAGVVTNGCLLLDEKKKRAQYNNEAYCTDFGPEYGYECIKPRHIKQLGDITLQHSCTPGIQKQFCIGDKFYTSCNQDKWIPMMCLRGQICSQTTSTTISCSSI
jgi:hypothetical protein